MAEKRFLDERFDLSIRAADRLHGYWESSGDIIERESGKVIARVYGRGRNGAAAQEEVGHEADRWLLRNGR